MAENKNCKGCIYHRKIDCLSGKAIFACYYCIDTGKLRECKPEACNKKDTNANHRNTDKSSLKDWCLNSRG